MDEAELLERVVMAGLEFERPAAVVIFAWLCETFRERQAPDLVLEKAAQTEAGANRRRQGRRPAG